MMMLQLLFTAIVGLLVNVIITPLVIRFAHRNEWYDEQNHRKIHTADTPRIGGVGIYIGFLAAGAVALLFTDERSVFELLLHYLPVLGGLTLVHALGLVDDFRNLRAALKLVVQIGAALLVTTGPFRIERLTIPYVGYTVELGVFSIVVTVLWIVAVSNALNFIDGVDGLAGGHAMIAAAFFAAIAVLSGQQLTALFAVGLVGATAGFLIYNMPPARIFMGDSGSYVLGFLLALFPLIPSGEPAARLSMLPAVTIVGFALLDMLTSVFRRIARGKHPFSADREHIHHKLIDLGMGTGKILAMTYSASIVLGLAGVAWYLVARDAATTIALVCWAIAALLLVLLNRAYHQLPPEELKQQG